MNIHSLIGLGVLVLLLAACSSAQKLPATPTQSPSPTTTPAPPTTVPTATPTRVPPPMKNVSYQNASDDWQQLDVYLPDGKPGPFPTILGLHGGMANRTSMLATANYFVERGYAVVAPNIRGRRADTYPGPVQDAFCALAWTHANAAAYGFDPARIVVVGHSLGGTAAAMLGMADAPSKFMPGCPHKLPDKNRVRAVVTFTGIFDYSSAAAASGGMRAYVVGYLGAEQAKSPEVWREASPITWIKGQEPPFLLVHGLNDQSIDPEQSKKFATELEHAGVKVKLALVPNAGHTEIISSPESFQAVQAFLAELGLAP